MGLQMSFAHTHSVLLNSDLTKGQKLVLGVIGTFTDQGGKCWPAIETIAFRCAMCVRTVQGHINDLVKLHYLTRTLRIGRSAIIQLTQKAMGWLTGTPAEIAPPPPQKLHPEPVIEPINQITAQPAAPVVAESPAGAAIVVLKAMDTEVRDTAPLASLPVIDVELVAHLPVVELVADLPIIDVVAHLPVVDVPAAVITVDLVADTAPAIAPVVELVPAVQMPDAPVVATDTAPAMPDAATAQAPADTVAVGLVPAVDVPALPAANVPDAVAQVQALPTAPVVDNPLADCPPQALADFGLAREKKGRSATPTSTELSILGKQGAAVGLTISQVIMLCAGEGWAWFQSKWATPPVMERFRAEWMPGQAPVTSVQLVLVPESAPPASPDVINAAKANIARIKAEQIDRLAVQRYRL